MTRRRRFSDGEQDQLQALKHENGELKREVQKLRKQISRLDLDRFQNFKDALDRIDEIEMEQTAKKREKTVSKDKWRCWSCARGSLRLKIWDRLGGAVYHRICDNTECGKRTTMKRWTPEVKE